MNSEKVKDDAVGRWAGIFATLGIEVGDGKHRACPMCAGKDRFRFDDKEGNGTWFCNNCGAGDGWSLLQQKMAITFPEAIESVAAIVGTVEKGTLPAESSATPEYLRKIFIESTPARPDNLVGIYLKGRGLTKVPDCLRYSKKCWDKETKKNQNAMLAIFTGPDNIALTMHRTYLDADGEKLGISKPKKILPPLRKMTGGAVRLFKAEEGTLGIAEGIETAIAASEDTGIPVWAALSSTLLESFEVPSGVKTLVIFADNDKNYAGQKSAYDLANRVSIKNGISVSVYVPNKPGEDWLDVFNAQRSNPPSI